MQTQQEQCSQEIDYEQLDERQKNELIYMLASKTLIVGYYSPLGDKEKDKKDTANLEGTQLKKSIQAQSFEQTQHQPRESINKISKPKDDSNKNTNSNIQKNISEQQKKEIQNQRGPANLLQADDKNHHQKKNENKNSQRCGMTNKINNAQNVADTPSNKQLDQVMEEEKKQISEESQPNIDCYQYRNQRPNFGQVQHEKKKISEESQAKSNGYDNKNQRNNLDQVEEEKKQISQESQPNIDCPYDRNQRQNHNQVDKEKKQTPQESQPSVNRQLDQYYRQNFDQPNNNTQQIEGITNLEQLVLSNTSNDFQNFQTNYQDEFQFEYENDSENQYENYYDEYSNQDQNS
ncbi:hypothetical protein ABPG74_004980 [Tetrahymena malaccensis]